MRLLVGAAVREMTCLPAVEACTIRMGYLTLECENDLWFEYWRAVRPTPDLADPMEPHLPLCLPVFIKLRRAFCDSSWAGEQQLDRGVQACPCSIFELQHISYGILVTAY